MSQKSRHKRNLMSVSQLLSLIAKYADEPTKCLKEVQPVIKPTFLMVQGMPAGDKCSPELVVRVLMDCSGTPIDCEGTEHGAPRCHQSCGHGMGYGAGNPYCGWNSHHHKSQSRLLPVLCLYRFQPRAVNNHVQMHF